MSGPIDLRGSRYDLNTYSGRVQHFLSLTNPLNAFATSAQLDEAKRVVDAYMLSKRMPEGYNEDMLWKQKYLYDSAYHPETGEKMFVLGRMAAQAPMNTIITAGMITFYKTTRATVFWQWINQTFNALVNYTNRSGSTPMPMSQLVGSYCAACGGALGTALFLNAKAKKMKNPAFAAMVPFAAVCAANFINIPMMRSGEIINGAECYDEYGRKVGNSQRAAVLGIGLVCISRVIMAVPGMTLTPLITNYATKKGAFCKYPNGVLPFQASLVAVCVLFAVPMCCALFKQQVSLSVSSLEPNLQAHIKYNYPKCTEVNFNKGL